MRSDGWMANETVGGMEAALQAAMDVRVHQSVAARVEESSRCAAASAREELIGRVCSAIAADDAQ